MSEELDLELDVFGDEESENFIPDDSDINEEEFYETEYLEEIRGLARDYMKRFFSNKSMYCGGKIQNRNLLTDGNVTTVLTSEISEAIDLSHELLENSGEIIVSKNSDKIIEILNSIAKFRIPKEFAGGMLLLYLHFCEGIVVWE